MIKDFLFGKLKKYAILSGGTLYTVVGRSYSCSKKGFLTIRDGFVKIATFVNVQNICEI